MGGGGLVPGRSTLVMRWLQKRAEEVPFLSPVPQILWEPERTSHEPQFPRLSNGGNIIGSKFPEELSQA